MGGIILSPYPRMAVNSFRPWGRDPETLSAEETAEPLLGRFFIASSKRKLLPTPTQTSRALG